MQSNKHSDINFKEDHRDFPTKQSEMKIKAKAPSTLREAIESSQRMSERKNV